MSRVLIPEPRPIRGRADLEVLYEVPAGRHVRVNFVTSLDGAVEVDGRSGGLGGGIDRDAFMSMRAVCDVVLVGGGTARAEDYGPVRLDPEVQDRRRRRWQDPLPRLAVVSGRADLDRHSRLFEEDGAAPVIVLTTAKAAASHPELAGVAELVDCGELEVDLERAIGALAERGLARVLCEGGPRLSRQLVAAGLVDEMCVTISPMFAGPGSRRLSEAWPVGRPERLTLVSLIEGEGMLVARYRVR